MADLSKLGFVDGETLKLKRRMIVSASGREKEGKSNLGFTAPGPIAYFDVDHNIEGVIDKFIGQKKIHVCTVGGHDTPETAKVVWEKFRTAWATVLTEPGIRSIVTDTATELWELVRMARLGKLSQIIPTQYGPVNAEFIKILRDARDADKNIILLHKMKPQWVGKERTGDYERAGFGDMGFIVQVNVRMYRDPFDLNTMSPGAFHMAVENCTQNPDIQGLDLEGDMCNIATLGQMVFPGSSEEDWT